MSIKFDKEYFKKYADPIEFENIVEIDTIPQLLNLIRRKYGLKKAVCRPNGSIATFNQLLNDVAKVSSYFRELNCVGKNIGVYCSNGYWFEVISLGIMASGNVACLIPINFNQEMIEKYVQMLDIHLMIVDNNKIKKMEVIPYEQLMMVDPLLNPFNNEIQPNDDACIMLTGGTTGSPKGAILSHQNILSGTINGCYGLKHIFEQTYYCLIPLTHSFGFIRNMLCALYTGSLIYYNQNKQDIFKDLMNYKPTVLVIVPALAELFLNLIKGQGLNVVGGKLHTIISGSANVPPYLSKEYSKLNIVFCPGYGLTEMANIVSGNPESSSRPDSVGLLFPNQEGKIVNGELYLRGNNLFKGYYNNPIETNKSLADGWLKTGDLARFDNDGFLYITGRIKDIIVLPNGENVSPALLESKISYLDLIQDCLVYAQQNNFGNTELVCEVTLRPAIMKKLNLNNETAKQYVQNYINKLNEELLDFEHINKVIIRDKDFERNSAMKILRKK